MATLGTYDFFFDTADELEQLGTEFALVVKHPSGTGVIVMTNSQDAKVAKHMVAALNRTFRDRFNSSPDQDESDSGNME